MSGVRAASPPRKGDSSVIAKAIAVLYHLAAAGGDVGLGELAAQLELNKSTCHRILSTLASADFVERSGPGRYRLGIGALQVGSAMKRNLDVRQRALPAMLELASVTDETVYLCVKHRWQAVCVERIDGKFVAELTLRLGGSLPLHVGASPKVLLAALDDASIDNYLAENAPLEQLTPYTHVSAADVWESVRQTRRLGVAISHGDVMIHAKAFGAPVMDDDGVVVAAISVSGISARIPADREQILIGAVTAAAASASNAMGHGDQVRRSLTVMGSER